MSQSNITSLVPPSAGWLADSTPKAWEDAAARAFQIVVNYDMYTALDDAGVFSLINFRDLWEKDAWSMLAMKARYELGLDFSEADFLALLARKQHDYGPENILKFGHNGLRVRLWDKVARYENLKKRESLTFQHADNGENWGALNESLTDTLTDMIGYVVIDKMLSEGWFEKPLKADMIEPMSGGFGQIRGFDCT